MQDDFFVVLELYYPEIPAETLRQLSASLTFTAQNWTCSLTCSYEITVKGTVDIEIPIRNFDEETIEEAILSNVLDGSWSFDNASISNYDLVKASSSKK